MAFYILFIVFLLCWGFSRCILMNLHLIYYYGMKDIYMYFSRQKWKDFNYYGIDMFIGMFGHGKTLSMTNKARRIHKRFGKDVLFLSNYKLVGIPYVPLTNFNQIVEIGKENEQLNQYKGIVVLIDEIEDVLSHRNYASFPLQMLNVLTQQRKLHVYIMCSAQRFFMVDKLFRSITTHAIDCNKYWRFQHMVYYDAWDYENAMNSQLLKPIANFWWFVKDEDFNCYDTTQLISDNASSDFISNEENIVRKGLDAIANEPAIRRPSRQVKKKRKKGH